MLRHHLPQIVSQAGVTGRYCLSYLHLVSRTVMLSLARFESPRKAVRAALQQARETGSWGLREIGRRTQGFPLLIHYHIFKNAGTSFEWALNQVLGPGLHRYDKTDAGGFVSPADLVSYVAAHPDARAIASHQLSPPAPRLPGRHVLTSILIRDPIARIRSVYAFERLQPNNGIGSVKAKELDFKGYVEWRLENAPKALCNFQVYFCLRAGLPIDYSAGRAELARAIALLDEIDIVGTVERYPEWLSLAEAVLSESFEAITLPSVHHNRTKGAALQSEAEILTNLSAELGSNLAHRLLEENELDMCLHQVADSLLSRRLAERSVLIRLREAYGTARAGQYAAVEEDS